MDRVCGWRRQTHLTHSPSLAGLPPWRPLVLALEPRGQGRATVCYISRPCDRHSVVENGGRFGLVLRASI